MSIELRPLGVACNIMCQYCYQNPQRDAGFAAGRYDIEAMKAAILATGGPFSLFGGEPLLLPEEDLEALWSWGYERFGRNSVQTNGSLINPAHVRMIKQYKVAVGISVDGPEDLNDLRWAGSVEATRERTARTQAAIEHLCKEGVSPNLIVTLHRQNAAAERLPRMADWLHRMDKLGVSRVRLHVLESEGPAVQEKFALSTEENIHAFLFFAALERELTKIRFDLFQDMRDMLVGNDEHTACVWHACDPYTTEAVQGIEGSGQRTNCGRTNKDGIDFVKADTSGHERQIALYHTVQEHGGCEGCRFFLMCKGSCPGTSLQGDWRNRSEHCGEWMALYEHFENVLLSEGVTPLSRLPVRKRLEEELLSIWKAGSDKTIASLLRRLATGSEKDEVDSAPTADPAGFRMHRFQRISWVGDEARRVWEPRVNSIRRMWSRLTREAVAQGALRGAVEKVGWSDLEALSSWSTQRGLTLVPTNVDLRNVGRAGTHDPLIFRMILCRPQDEQAFRNAFSGENAAEIGELLGYPQCCVRFFEHLRSTERVTDPTWHIAVNTAGDSLSPCVLSSPPELNFLLRSIGVRAIAHLPCSFDCADSLAAGRELLRLAETLGFHEQIFWLREMLDWPVEWSALHGIAEIRTPVLKIITSTDATSTRFLVQRRGDAYPKEGASGLAFPYALSARPPLTSSPAFLRGLSEVVSIGSGRAGR